MQVRSTKQDKALQAIILYAGMIGICVVGFGSNIGRLIDRSCSMQIFQLDINSDRIYWFENLGKILAASQLVYEKRSTIT